ncbi:MAG: hypothetical protein GC149_03460 [Gammaproteobacteria bacterium]|nr:hypothetical protein [Gammaproteobacteria bacterium]
MLTLLTGCGGGGGGGGTTLTDDPVPPMPSRVHYVAGGPGGDPSTTGLFLQDGMLSITSTFYLEGTYTPASKTYSLTQSPVPRFGVVPSGLSFTLPVSDPVNGGFFVTVEESLEWVYGQHPTSGAFRAQSGNFIRIKVNNDIDLAGTPGVDIALVEFGSTTASASLSWSEFDIVLNDNSAPDYQREAALAYQALEYLYKPLNRVVENFNTLRAQENTLEAAGSGQQVSVPLCTTFNATPGTFNLTWLDGPGDIAGSMGSGDNFSIAVNNCWIDDPASNKDLLYDSGQIQLKTYGESTTPFVLGFNDVVFIDLQITPTAQTGPGLGTLGSSIVYNTFSSVAGRDGFYLELTPDVSGTLNLVNVVQVATATSVSFTMPSELGNFAVNLLSDVLGSAATSGTNLCPVSGSYDYSLSNNPFVNGATMDVTFHDCVQGTVADQTKVNGNYILTATAYTSTANLTFDLAFTNVITQDDVSTRTIDGQMHFSRVVSGGTTSNEVSSSISGQSLIMSESGITASLSNFSFTGTRTASGLTLGTTGETFTLQLSTLTDPLAGRIESTFSGTEMTALQAGSVRVTAADTSNFLLTITDASGAVTLALDSDGNGSAEDTVNTTWSDLY